MSEISVSFDELNTAASRWRDASTSIGARQPDLPAGDAVYGSSVLAAAAQTYAHATGRRRASLTASIGVLSDGAAKACELLRTVETNAGRSIDVLADTTALVAGQ